jgi:hypothetical protein
MAHATLGFLAFLEMPQPICFWQAIALVLSDEAGDRVNQLETYAPSRVAGDERPRRRLDAALQRCIDAAALQWIGWFSTLLGDQVVTLWTFWVHIAIGSVTGGDNGGDARCDGFVGCCRGCCVGRCCSPPRTKMELPFSCGGNSRISIGCGHYVCWVYDDGVARWSAHGGAQGPQVGRAVALVPDGDHRRVCATQIVYIAAAAPLPT